MFERGFGAGALTPEQRDALSDRARRLRGAILTMTSVASSGHPGGSMSSLEMYLTLYHFADVRPDDPRWSERDRIVIDHGHTSPAAYAALADAGFFPLDDAVAHFRQAESPFEGHVERSVPGIEWNTGNLGQGLSAAVGMAFASRLTGGGWHTYCLMGDGGQHKGQVAEARRVASHHGLVDLTVLIDVNRIQITGRTADVLAVDIAADWAADGWRVVEVDGHDIAALYEAVRAARENRSAPVALLCRTTIGKGVSFMEDDPAWHGAPLEDEAYVRAMTELGLEPQLDRARARRGEAVGVLETPVRPTAPVLEASEPRTYGPDRDRDDRSAWGAALVDIASANPGLPLAVVDCDLAPSVKTSALADIRPEGFLQLGIGEHNAAVVAGALSVSGVLTFWADFGVFGIDEVYNQQRLNDINATSLKLVLTHCGLDVGEDGKTHQCLDYVGALRNCFGWKVIVPADPNQTDRAVRWATGAPGNVAIAMGRSKLPVLLGQDGAPLFGDGYVFEHGRIDWARQGGDATILAMGTVCGAALEATDRLRADGYDVGMAVVATPLDLDDEAMQLAARTGAIVTVEDHSSRTGLGAAVAEWAGSHGVVVRLVRLGVDRYASSGSSADLLRIAGLDVDGIEATARLTLS